jgi:hypothetical protein
VWSLLSHQNEQVVPKEASYYRPTISLKLVLEQLPKTKTSNPEVGTKEQRKRNSKELKYRLKLDEIVQLKPLTSTIHAYTNNRCLAGNNHNL